jgi:hypothetical protein
VAFAVVEGEARLAVEEAFAIKENVTSRARGAFTFV